MKKVLIFHQIWIFNRVSQISCENQNPRSQLFAKTVVNDVKKGKIFSKCFPIKLILKEDIDKHTCSVCFISERMFC